MKRILVATDFSTRSDRALRRATLLAQQESAEIILAHVVDDDLPSRLLKTEQREAMTLLAELVETVSRADKIVAHARVALGEPFAEIAAMAEEADADLIVMGPHRRQVLRDMFVGTTIERTIRRTSKPVIMANAVPAGRYDRVLLATDLSDCSALALEAAKALGFLSRGEFMVLHAFEAAAEGLLARSAVPMDEFKAYLAEEEERASRNLKDFLKRFELGPHRDFVQLIELSAATTIRDYVRKHHADLVVIGTHGRTGAAKLALGSVAEDVMRESDIDVLVVPSKWIAQAAA